MKTRVGFVSNSSSSSFILLESGTIFSGMDMCASDFDLFECTEGHCIEKEFFDREYDYDIIKCRGYEKFHAYMQLMVQDDGSFDYPYIMSALPTVRADWDGFWAAHGEGVWEGVADDGSALPSYCCPICELEVPINDVALLYLLGKNDMTLEDVRAKAKAEYGSLSEMQSALSNIEIIKYKDA